MRGTRSLADSAAAGSPDGSGVVMRGWDIGASSWLNERITGNFVGGKSGARHQSRAAPRHCCSRVPDAAPDRQRRLCSAADYGWSVWWLVLDRCDFVGWYHPVGSAGVEFALEHCTLGLA